MERYEINHTSARESGGEVEVMANMAPNTKQYTDQTGQLNGSLTKEVWYTERMAERCKMEVAVARNRSINSPVLAPWAMKARLELVTTNMMLNQRYTYQ
jgi:hypothetical protein